jgi:hypothetical protein
MTFFAKYDIILFSFLATNICGQFHRGGSIQGVLLYTMTPWKTSRKSMGEWDYRTRIIPLLSSMKPGREHNLSDNFK